MADTPVRFTESGQVTTSFVTYYTSPANTKSIVKNITVTNVSAGAVTVTVALVASGGTAGTTNTLISAKIIGANQAVILYPGINHNLEPGDFISVKSDTTPALNLMISGFQSVPN